MRTRLGPMAAIALAALVAGACASGGTSAYKAGMQAVMAGDWDTAVAHLTQAVQESPDRQDYRMQLQRAMERAALIHIDRARSLAQSGDLEAALVEYRRTLEYSPGNREAIQKVAELERAVRERFEASLPKPPIDGMRERARKETQGPLLSPTSREPLSLRFTQASTRDILNFIGQAAGINVLFEKDFVPRPFSIQLEGVPLESALGQIMAGAGLWYKVVDERTVLVIDDTPQKRQAYEDQVIRTFYLSHADPQELTQLVTTLTRIPGATALIPSVAANKSANSITVRGTRGMVEIIERIIESNDKPRAEVIVDVEILEVNRIRAQQYGLNLSQYAIGTVFSPEGPPAGGTGSGSGGSGSGGSGGAVVQSLINLNSITRGISTADFYMAVPQAIVRFLASDSQTRQIAKPQLRGMEGQKLTLNLGDEIPVPSTVFTPIATGGVSVNPLTSFTYRPVGVNVEMTPRVTFEGDIVLELLVESSNLGDSVNVAGTLLPSFGSRKVTTRLRLREGESNLLAGLIGERERKSLQGIPGIMNLPIFKQLLSGNDNSFQQTDIVMLITPRIVRGHELTQDNLAPIPIGTQQSVGLTNPAELFGGARNARKEEPAGALAGRATELLSIATARLDGALQVTIRGNGRLVPGAVQEAQDMPPRLVLDFPGLTSGVPGVTAVDGDDVEKIRVALNSRTPLTTRVVFDLKRRLPYRIDTTGQDRGEVIVVLGESGGRTAAAAVATVGTAPEPPRPVPEEAPARPPATAPLPAPTVTPPTGARPGLPSPPTAAPPGLPRPAAEVPSTAPVTGQPGMAPAPPSGATPAGASTAQVVLSLPSAELTVDGGPYSVPISIANASRVSVVSLSITFNPAVLKVRSVQEGSFLRQGGIGVTFTHQADAAAGRIDISMTRVGDATGASGAGLIAAILFDAVEPGAVTFTLGGVATDPQGVPVPLAFSPASATVR